MKKLFSACLILASGLLIVPFCTVAHAQEAHNTGKAALATPPAKEESWPSLTASIPGLYVNGWPGFTLTYPENWIEVTPEVGEVFHVVAPGAMPLPVLVISVFSSPLPLDQSIKMVLSTFQRIGNDVKVLYERPSQLRNGMPAYEGQIEWVHNSGLKLNTLLLATKKDDVWVLVSTSDLKDTVGVDRKSIVYSLKVKQGKESAVSLPPDVQRFLEKACGDLVSHDTERIAGNHSDRFRDYGRDKARRVGDIKGFVSQITSCETRITVFEPQGEKAYLAGYIITNLWKVPLLGSDIINEDGQWKWYGNQK